MHLNPVNASVKEVKLASMSIPIEMLRIHISDEKLLTTHSSGKWLLGRPIVRAFSSRFIEFLNISLFHLLRPRWHETHSRIPCMFDWRIVKLSCSTPNPTASVEETTWSRCLNLRKGSVDNTISSGEYSECRSVIIYSTHSRTQSLGFTHELTQTSSQVAGGLTSSCDISCYEFSISYLSTIMFTKGETSGQRVEPVAWTQDAWEARRMSPVFIISREDRNRWNINCFYSDLNANLHRKHLSTIQKRHRLLSESFNMEETRESPSWTCLTSRKI